jgi:hypothetical protein
MNPRLAHLLIYLYPRPWRERYGAEFEVLLQTGPGDLRTMANVVWSALRERVSPTPGLTTNQYPHTVMALARQPSAFLPMAMSLTALAVLLGALANGLIQHHPLVREPDEGAIAHIWQLLMGGQMPVLAFFAIKWLPRAPRQTLCVLLLQAGAALASMAPVYFLNL